MVRKVTLGILISILSVFAMSYNANAIDFTIDLDSYSLRRNSSRPNIQLYWNSDTTTCDNASECRVFDTSTTSKVKKMMTHATYTAKMDDIFILRVLISNQANNGVFTKGSLYGQRNFTTNNDYLVYLGENIYTTADRNFWTDLGYGPNSNEYYTQLYTVYQSFALHEYYFRVLRDGTYQVGFESTNYNSNALNIFNLTDYSSDSATLFSIMSLTQYEASESRENREQEQKTQEAVDQSTSDGNSSQNTVESSTQSLMSAGGSIISALVNAPATDCNISVQTTGNSRLFTTAIGQLNLCSDVPQGVLTMVQGIVALVFTPIVLYFTYNVLTTLYNQFKEYNS